MASGKHRRGKRKRKPPPNASSGDLAEQVRRLLARGDGRGALDRLRQAKPGDASAVELPLLRFCACIERARQLARSALDREAAAMRTQAARHRASISPAALAEEDLARYVRYLDGADALAVYADYLTVGRRAPAAERALADRLVIRRCWDGLEGYEPSHPLRRDAGAVKRSLGAMDAGDWGRAGDLMQSVARHSPFAPWRVFCKAMVCFGAGDDAGLERTLDLLPGDFVLAETVAEWRRVCAGEGGGGPVRVRRALGTEGTAVEALGEALRQALRHNERPRTVERLVTELADVLCPEEPLQARIDLLQIAGLATLRSALSMQSVRGLVRRLVPAGRAPAVVARIELLLQQASPDLWDPGAAAVFLNRLDTEFPQAGDRALARGRVLEALARTGHRAIHPEVLPPRMLKTLSVLLDGRLDRPGLLFAELMAASLEVDPYNREGYRFVLDLLRGHRDIKPRQRSTLEAMAAHFPDDPDPWLELVTLHHSMNAYRRAEQALGEARRRAPHDERILDLQAIGFLRSADQSRKSGRFELAARDLRRAGELSRPKLESILAVKHILLDVVSAGRDAAEVVVPHLARLSPDMQIRTLAVVLHDLEENRHVKNVRPEMESAVRGLLARKAAVIDELGPDRVVDLLAPLSADLHVLYSRLHIAPVLAEWWAAFLRRQDGDGLVQVFDILMDCGERTAIRAEIGRRLRGLKKTRRDPVLLLYLAVLRYQAGDDHDSRRFVEALEAAHASERERLRAASVRLARVAHGILREALLAFDFALLNLLPPPFGGGVRDPIPEFLNELLGSPHAEGPDELFGAPEPEPAHEPSLDAFMEALREGLGDASPGGSAPRQESLFDNAAAGTLDAFEDLLDRHALRGLSAPLLQDVAGIARADPEIRRTLERTARECDAAGLRPAVTREARIFLFPRSRGKRRR